MKLSTKQFLRKSVFLLALSLIWASSFAQAPSNDLCSDAAAIQPGDVLAGTTVGATVPSVSYCGASITSPAVWYKIVGDGAALTVSTCDYANFDTRLSVYSGTCAGLQCVTGNDDAPNCGSFRSEVTFASVSGQDYYILVHGFASTTGAFNLSASTSAGVVANDDVTNADNISWGSTITGTTIGASADVVPDCKGVASTAPGVWYTYTGDGSKVKFSTCGTTGYDTRLSLYEGTPSALVCVEANDDNCALQSELVSQSVAGTTYYLLVHGFGSSAGAFSLQSTLLMPPSNDEPCNAISIAMGDTLPFDLTNATADVNEVTPGPGDPPNTCQSQTGWCYFEPDVQNSVWYAFVAPSSGCVNVLADGFDTQLAIWGASDCADYATYEEIAANDDSGPKVGAQVIQSAAVIEAACLTPGATYYVQIDGFNGFEGNGTLAISDCGNAPLSMAIDSGRCQARYIGYTGNVVSDTVYLRAEAAGGFGPYKYQWDQDSSIVYTSEDKSSIAVVPTGNTTYTCTATDAAGCTVSSSSSISVVDLSCSFSPVTGGFRTQTQGGWGAACSGGNAGCYRDANFDAAFPNGMVIGCDAGYTITFTSAAAIYDFLPSGTRVKTLDQDWINPLRRGSDAYKNILAGQLTAVSLSLGFDAYDPSFGSSGAWLGDVIINTGMFSGWTVSELVQEANLTLGGCSTQYNLSDLNDALDMVNNAFVDGTQNNSTAFLVPGVTLCNNGVESCVDQGDVEAALAAGSSLGSCTNTCDFIGPYFPPPVPCEVLTVRTYGDIFSETETSWTLLDLTTGEEIWSNVQVPDLEFAQYDTCLNPTHCYQLTISDIFSDGFNPWFGGGWYEVVFLNDSIRSEFVSGSSETATLGDCSSRLSSEVVSQDIEMIAYPNPFRVDANLDFRIPEAADVKIEIFNLQGQLVETIFNGHVEANVPYTARFRGTQHNQGVYFYQLTTDKGYTKEGKLILQK